MLGMPSKQDIAVTLACIYRVLDALRETHLDQTELQATETDMQTLRDTIQKLGINL